jgi:PKD repeat protein
MKGWSSAGGRGATWLGTLIAAIGLFGAFAPGAGAVVVRESNGRLAGVTLRAGVSPASLRGGVAPSRSAANPFSSNGNLDYHSGPVLHGSAPYLVFWDPGSQISAADKVLYERYFADVAADSGKATNVFSVGRQFTDSTGFADYNQAWSSSHAITDTQAYPTTGQCTEHSFSGETACLFDAQLQAEVTRLIAADGLPTGITGDAPIYFVVTPPTVNSCISDNTTCADNLFCAYHSSYTDGAATVLYADVPTLLAVQHPKGCQADNNSVVQEPNGRPIADVAIKYMSHEDNESITDPLGTAWWDTNSGNEDGDNCNFYGPTVDPTNSSNPNAFSPTLGGSASAGTLYDQLINGNPYYTQSEWSNGDINCEMEANASALSASFIVPATATSGVPVSLNPSASSSAAGYTSTTWSFGDGTNSFSRAAPATAAHTYSANGVYTVTLTLVDAKGNLATTTHTVDVGPTPTAAFFYTPSSPLSGSPVSFDGSASSEAGGSIASYSWDFGDGSAAGSGVTPTHAYASAGTYMVTLTVTDGHGNSGGTSQVVTVDAVAAHASPSAAFSFTPASPVSGSPVSFDGSGSSEPGGSIVSYSWSFGDGSVSAGGVTPSHAYSHAGTYTVSLTVTDAIGVTGGATKQITVSGRPSAAFTIRSKHPVGGVPVPFDASTSTDTGATLVSSSWNFGDGQTGSGVTPVHTYGRVGHYAVTLTVTDSSGATSSSTHQIAIAASAITAANVKVAKSGAFQLRLTFDGPGVLTTGSRRIVVGSPGTITLRYKLTSSQLGKLNRKHTLKLAVKLKFLPRAGGIEQQTVTVKLRTK